MKGIFILLVGLALVLLAALAGGPVLERNRRAGEVRELRAVLEEARFLADSCKVALARAEETFRSFDREVDSLRGVVDGFEDAEKGGVPQEEYSDYLAGFERYNALVEEWQVRADTLQAEETRCRSLVEAHNTLSDSIRTIQEEARGG